MPLGTSERRPASSVSGYFFPLRERHHDLVYRSVRDCRLSAVCAPGLPGVVILPEKLRLEPLLDCSKRSNGMIVQGFQGDAEASRWGWDMLGWTTQVLTGWNRRLCRRYSCLIVRPVS
jgi:hypothetical protein